MAQAILFRLDAPLAAFGSLAVGERRGVDQRPAFSAIIGMVAGALGLTREARGQKELAASFWLATRRDGLGAALADFHTAQTPPQRRGRRFATRAEELADKSDLGTIISRRDYWTDVAFTILLWPTPECVHEPEKIAQALNRPRFAGFAGRKSCPLGRPPAARVVEAQNLGEAFAAYDQLWTKAESEDPMIARPSGAEIAFDLRLGAFLGDWREIRRETRRDDPQNRSQWQFAPRVEALAAPPAGEAP